MMNTSTNQPGVLIMKIETTNKFTGQVTVHTVHPTQAFKFINHQRRAWNISSVRVVG